MSLHGMVPTALVMLLPHDAPVAEDATDATDAKDANDAKERSATFPTRRGRQAKYLSPMHTNT